MPKPLPTVAIVGRANVGKSSLFNRLVGAQQAIVAREPGTTRDSVTSQVSYKNRAFRLVDTAGLKAAEDEFEATIQEQIDDAAVAADLILVVIDSTVIPGDEDYAVAKKALRSKKPTILVINKTDKAEALGSEDFLKLGLKKIVRTSAEHNRGITELIDAIAAILPPRRETPEDNLLRVALIGRPNTGKSSLFNTLAGKQQAIVSQRAGTTRDVGRTLIHFAGQSIELMDTAGIRRPGKIGVGIEKFSVLRTMQAIEQSDICLLMMDVNELNVSLDQKLAGIAKDAGRGLVLVVSKWDTAKDKTPFTRDELAGQISAQFDFVPWAPLIFTSSLTGQNVSKIFELALEINSRRHQQLKTAELNRVLQRCMADHPPAGLRNSHPRPRYLVQTDTSPPWFVLFGSDLRYLHWSYKRFLERTIRENFDFAGTPVMFSYRDQKVEKERAGVKKP